MFADWTDPEATFGILQELTRGRPCDLTGVAGYDHIDTGSVQWPLSEAAVTRGEGRAADDEIGGAAVERRLFTDGRFFTPTGRARFVVDDVVDPPEKLSDRYPLVLLTGRGSSSEWHTGTRTSKSAVLRSLAPEGLWIEIHPDDAEPRGIHTGATVVVRSVRGHVLARAQVVETVGAGRVFLPMHDSRTNVLTYPAFDPQSRQPAYKYSAVEVAHPKPWELAAT